METSNLRQPTKKKICFLTYQRQNPWNHSLRFQQYLLQGDALCQRYWNLFQASFNKLITFGVIETKIVIVKQKDFAEHDVLAEGNDCGV